MEIYLSHMVIFRVFERLGLHEVIGNGWMQYVLTVVLVVAGAVAFAVVMQRIIGMGEKIITEMRVRKVIPRKN